MSLPLPLHLLFHFHTTFITLSTFHCLHLLCFPPHLSPSSFASHFILSCSLLFFRYQSVKISSISLTHTIFHIINLSLVWIPSSSPSSPFILHPFTFCQSPKFWLFYLHSYSNPFIRPFFAFSVPKTLLSLQFTSFPNFSHSFLVPFHWTHTLSANYNSFHTHYYEPILKLRFTLDFSQATIFFLSTSHSYDIPSHHFISTLNFFFLPFSTF